MIHARLGGAGIALFAIALVTAPLNGYAAAPAARHIEAGQCTVVDFGRGVWGVDYGPEFGPMPTARPKTRPTGPLAPQLLQTYQHLQEAAALADADYKRYVQQETSLEQINQFRLATSAGQPIVDLQTAEPPDTLIEIQYNMASDAYVHAYQEYGDPTGQLPNPQAFNSGDSTYSRVEPVAFLPDGRVIAFKAQDINPKHSRPASLWLYDGSKATCVLKSGDAVHDSTGAEIGTLVGGSLQRLQSGWSAIASMNSTGRVLISAFVHHPDHNEVPSVLVWNLDHGPVLVLAIGDDIPSAGRVVGLTVGATAFLNDFVPLMHLSTDGQIMVGCEIQPQSPDTTTLAILAGQPGRLRAVAILQRHRASRREKNVWDYSIAGGALAALADADNLIFDPRQFRWMPDNRIGEIALVKPPASAGRSFKPPHDVILLGTDLAPVGCQVAADDLVSFNSAGSMTRSETLPGATRPPTVRLTLTTTDGHTTELARFPIPAPGLPEGYSILRAGVTTFSSGSRMALLATVAPQNNPALSEKVIYFLDATKPGPLDLACRLTDITGPHNANPPTKCIFNRAGSLYVQISQPGQNAALGDVYVCNGQRVKPVARQGDTLTLPGGNQMVINDVSLLHEGAIEPVLYINTDLFSPHPGYLLIPNN